MAVKMYVVSGLRDNKPALASKHTFCDDRFGLHTVFNLDAAVARYFDIISRGGTNMQICPVLGKNPLVLGVPVPPGEIERLRKLALAAAHPKNAA